MIRRSRASARRFRDKPRGIPISYAGYAGFLVRPAASAR
ncbi:hypothetical protein PY32053_01177 [Paracoccus yeei]|uniref:Uncharacterized protein n=1 Tax=Paracoccus yeei TaxID=147645 RepID=A0A386UJH8_9RHOB|nr:hypothetical protein PY32053_01177 [Paracoccus yeei]